MKKILSVILIITLIFSVLPTGLFSITASALTNEFAGGSGTPSSPYLIQTKSQLNNVRNNKSAHYKLTSNIVFTAEDFTSNGDFYNSGYGFEPIGSSSTDAFSGRFDGNGFSIVGIYISTKNTEYTGLFGYSTGTIENLGMVDGNISANISYGSAGGIAGLNYGVINNCYNAGSVTITGSATNQVVSKVGGIAGTNYSTISNCYNVGTLKSQAYSTYSPQAYSGGIAGYCSGTIVNCYNVGNVSASTSAGSNAVRNIKMVGGICANKNGGYISSCYYLNTNQYGVGENNYSSVIKCTEAKMKQQATFVGFDFQSVWEFDESLVLHKFPVLKNVKHVEDGNLVDYVEDGYIYTVVNNIRYKIKNGVATLVMPLSTSVEEIVIPSEIIHKDITYNLTGISDSAFLGCSDLTEITIPKGVTNIGNNAFKDCANMTDVWYEGLESDKSNITVGVYNVALTRANWHYDSCMKNYDEHSHTYEGCMDANCNNCNKIRNVPAHVYDGCYDRICNACDFVRDNDHFYTNDWDKSCDKCGYIRNVGPFTITYHLDGGTNAVKNPDMYTEEDTITLKDASKVGYDFGGWFLDADKTEAVTEIYLMGNVELYAKFLPKSYKATFDSNGAEKSEQLTITLHTGKNNTKKTVTVNNGDTFSPYQYWQPEVSGYVFVGWMHNSNLIGDQIEINDDIDLYAKWVSNPNNYPVLGEDVNSISAYCNEKYFYISCNYTRIYYEISAQSKYTEVLSPTTHLVQYRYSASSYSSISANGLNVSLPGYTTLKNGTWQEDDYVTLEPGTLVRISNSQSGDLGNLSVGGRVDVEITTKTAHNNKITVAEERTKTQSYDSVIDAPEVSKNGYELLGWYDSQGNQMTERWQYLEDKTFTAKWGFKKYDIIYELDGGVNNPLNPNHYTIEDLFALENPTKSGYTFKGWYSDADFSTQVTSISNKTGNITLYAKWEVNSYNLTLNANNGAFAPKVTFISDGAEVKSCYLYGQDTITAYRPDDKKGYIFAGWYTDDAFTSLFKFNGTITNDITLYAKWIKCDNNIVKVETVGNVNTTIQGKTERLYAFIPLNDGNITVTSESNNLDLYGSLYDANKIALISADDISDTDLDFSYTYSVKAGQLYYISVKGNTASTAGQAVVKVVWTGDCTVTGTTYNNIQFTVVYGTNYKLPKKPIREGYMFLGWFDENGAQITEGTWNFVTDKILTAKWGEATYHTVIFKDVDGKVISSERYYLSEDITAPELPIKEPDNKYTYSSRWDNNYTGICTGDAVYSLVFDAEYIEYTVVFADEDGTELSRGIYHWGDVVTPPAAPTKEADANYAYIYTFAGWGKPVVNCAGNTTYTATYNTVPLKQLLLVSEPNKVRYRVGETIDLTGLSLQCVYANGTKVSLSGVSTQFVSADLSSPGKKTVAITIAGVSAEFKIYVHDVEEKVLIVDSSLYPQSSHNYSNNLNEIKTFTYPGAESLVITFSGQTSVENNWDYIYVYDGAGNQIAKYTGTTAANKTLTIVGDTFKIKLYSDSFNVRYGYAFSEIKACMGKVGEIIHLPVIDLATVTCTQGGLTEGSHCEICGDILVAQKEVAALGHNYKTVFTWSKDHTSCTVSITCERGCDLNELLDCTVTHSEPHQSQTIHTAVAEYNGTSFTDIYTCDNFLIVFKNWDETLLSSTYYHMGDAVIIPSNPDRMSDNTYTYTFAGWDKEIVDCNGDATYTATYTSNYIDYTVVFKNWNGDVLSTKTYHYGDTVTAPNTPNKAADNVYTYTFAGWDSEVVNCSGNATYTATYTSNYIDYTVIFKNWDGTVLSTKTYHYGDTVTAPNTPNKAADNVYTYTFAGWDSEVVNCSGNATYTAIYTPQYIEYTITFKNYDGTVLSSKNYHYGDYVVTPDTPIKPEDKDFTYIFDGWDSEIVVCTENKVYTATFKATKKYTPGDINDDGRVDLTDVVALAQYAAGWDVYYNENALDVNGDGFVNLTDVVHLSQYVAGWDVVLN